MGSCLTVASLPTLLSTTLPIDFSNSNLNVGNSSSFKSGSGTLFLKVNSSADAWLVAPIRPAAAATPIKPLRVKSDMRRAPAHKDVVNNAVPSFPGPPAARRDIVLRRRHCCEDCRASNGCPEKIHPQRNEVATLTIRKFCLGARKRSQLLTTRATLDTTRTVGRRSGGAASHSARVPGGNRSGFPPRRPPRP